MTNIVMIIAAIVIAFSPLVVLGMILDNADY